MKSKMIAFLIMLTSLIALSADAFEYAILSYSDNSGYGYIDLKIVDLDQKNITTTVTIPIAGELVNRIPAKFSIGNHIFYLVLTIDGSFCKNCEQGNEVNRFAVLDSNFNIILNDSLTNMAIFNFLNQDGNLFYFKYFDIIDGRSTSVNKGKFNINNGLRPTLIQRMDENFNPFVIEGNGRFSSIHKSRNSPLNFYWDTDDFKLYLLKLNHANNAITDTFYVGDYLNYTEVFNISPLDSLFYIFNLSYDIPRNGILGENRNMKSNYLLKFEISEFALQDSVDISNLTNQDEFIPNELGECDIIGPYFVYYFFKSDDYRYFAPAMLFIFDTRTNEASWLRVGWR